MDPLFPVFPETPKELTAFLQERSDEDLVELLKEHEDAAALIEEENEEFLRGATGEEILEALEIGAVQVEAIRAEQAARKEAEETYTKEKAEKLSKIKPKAEEAEEEEEESEEEEGDKESEEEAAVVAEAEEITEEAAEEPEQVEEKEKEAVTAAADPPKEERPEPPRKPLRRPPTPSAERQLQEAEHATALVSAAGLQTSRAGKQLTRETFAELVKAEAVRRGKPSHHEHGSEERILIARADYTFPSDRVLTGQADEDWAKIRAVIPENTGWGRLSGPALTASGGLCAPLTPIYSLPNFATDDEPVWEALPKFNAVRGGVNVPSAPVIGDIESAISNISADDDALGGTFATKSCQDLDCVDYTEVAVQILAHCREYGNLNARAWPERIALENDLTMAALARTSETFMLDRIKALSVNVTGGLETLGALIYLVDNIVKAVFGIRTRLRMSRGARFRALMPAILPDLLALDTVQTQFGRLASQGELVSYLGQFGISPAFYLDSPSDGASQIADGSQAAGALDPLPDTIQWAIYPEGAFLGIDGGSLELGIVRDSTLNSTNDFQVFGERFRNVARIAPEQATYWVSSDLCANGQFPPAGTARTCD